MRNRVGDIAVVTIDGKVAEKDKDGRLTGKMIQLKKGDIGKVVSERGVTVEWKSSNGHRYERQQRLFLLSMAKGMVMLRDNSVSFCNEDDMGISRAAFQKSHPDFKIRQSDMDEGADY